MFMENVPNALFDEVIAASGEAASGSKSFVSG
jgi:hypothetical protein